MHQDDSFDDFGEPSEFHGHSEVPANWRAYLNDCRYVHESTNMLYTGWQLYTDLGVPWQGLISRGLIRIVHEKTGQALKRVR